MKKVLLSWSSGKDSAWALHLLRGDPEIEVCGLITTFNAAFDRVAMHAVRRELAQMQADRAGLPLWPVELPWPCSNTEYEARMRTVCDRAMAEGVHAIAFGDLFLEDIREYRIRQLESTCLEPLFPLWLRPTGELAREMIAGGLKARLTCVDPRKLDASFAGREFDTALLEALPPAVDPCGENGEFHTFAYAAPVFSSPIRIRAGEIAERDGFVFADILPDALQRATG